MGNHTDPMRTECIIRYCVPHCSHEHLSTRQFASCVVGRPLRQRLQRPIKMHRLRLAHFDESHSKAEFASPIQRLGFHGDPAFVWQIDLQR